MDSNDRQESGECGISVPVELIKDVTIAIITALNKWHHDQGSDHYEMHQCIAAIMASADAAVDLISMGPEEGETMQ